MTENILVTGGNGSMGSWVSHELTRRGLDVVVLDLAAEPRVMMPYPGPHAVVVGDIRDASLVREVLIEHRVTRIVHLAAMVLDPCEDDPASAFEVNSVATARLVELAEHHGIQRLVANSTKGVLGPLPARHLHPTYDPVAVDHPPSPRSVYETSKYAVEPLISAARARGLSCTALRLATTWGPGKSGASHGSLGLHSDVVNNAMEGRSTRLDIHPEQGYDLIYYRDIARAIAQVALTADPLKRAVYHVGSGRIVTMRAFAAAVEAAFPGVCVELGDRFPAGRYCVLDIGPIREDVGFEPRFDVTRAIDDARSLAADLPTPGS